VTFDFRYPTPLPSTKGWGPGYPDCQEDKIVPHPIFQGGVRAELVELVDLLVDELQRRGYAFEGGDSWGYGCRGTKSSSGGTSGTPSFHSFGLGLDFNAQQNVFGSDRDRSDLGTVNGWVPQLMAEYGFFWLGPSIGDWMHFSFCGSPADARYMTEKARNLLGRKDDDEMLALDEYIEGQKTYQKLYRERLAAGKAEPDPGLPPEAKSDHWKAGWLAARFAANFPRP